MRLFLLLITLQTALIVAQAQQGADYLKEPLPDGWQEGELFEQTPPENDLWWQNFEDTQLDSLINVAIMRNPSVLAAIENMKKAELMD